ncbi:NAD(P)/FAD-dependent oxidoreductase [Paenibacillus sp. 1011MAR3C5]|uniref:NAD(P)/FAD-dependent oxidoreductase n=1 Tax=Paenibacillus sp. 1011MAR3C5 TaxID=1675787 RepID=UPI000E6D5338|nr:NAD(P)/FAD-dependent oxidoreductase [Paenibacillus sp. 1011MAR3C5]RJE86086.1 NAD(P)/FAD-dependent oxidoreductase [Paenibacillus sp. 1011MAR3C5]
MAVDCAIIGGGPAGMNAALVLGRARRSVMVFDDNRPRNAVTRHTHGFLTRDGVTPGELRGLAQRELAAYQTVTVNRQRVTDIRRAGAGFHIGTGDGAWYAARKVLLATGLRETLPPIPGIGSYYGRSLFNCPYCDGWELRDRPLIVIADGMNAFTLTRLAYQWSKDLILCTNGARRTMSDEERLKLQSRGIRVSRERVVELEGEDGELRSVRLESGLRVRRTGGFVSPIWRQAAPFGDWLGCAANEQGGIQTDRLGRTSVYGIYAAGDSSVIAPAQAVIAAGEGSKAAIGINADLIQEDF